MSLCSQTILGQLGGGKFVAMTGATEFLHGPEHLSFRLPRCGPSRRITHVKVQYMPVKDTYTLYFLEWSKAGLNFKEHAKAEDVYSDRLQEVFTENTGLETSL